MSPAAIRRCGLAVFGGLVAVLLFEGAARVYLLEPTPEWRKVFILDPKIGYRLIPNQRVKIRPSVDHQPY